MKKSKLDVDFAEEESQMGKPCSHMLSSKKHPKTPASLRDAGERPPLLTTTSTSLLYELLQRSTATRAALNQDRESTERMSHSRSASYGHSPRLNVELDGAVSETLHAEVSRMLPYRGVLLVGAECESGALPSPSTTTPHAATSARKDNVMPARQYRASLAKLNVNDSAVQNATTQSPGATAAPSPLSSSTATDATASARRRKAPVPTIVVKKRPPRRIADAEAAAAAAAAATLTAAPAPAQPSPAGVPAAGAAVVLSTEDRVPTETKRRVTVVSSSDVSVAQTHLKALLEDFAAAVEQCRVAVGEQCSGSMAAWEAARPDDDARELSTGEETIVTPPHSRRKSPCPRRRGNPTVLVADAPPRSTSAQLISEMVSPTSMAEMLRLDQAGGIGCAPLTDRSISIESPREAGEQSVCGQETTDLPRGIVTIACIIADHLHDLFHPTATAAELEEEAAALESRATNGGPAPQLAPSFQAHRARPGVTREDSRSVSPTSRTSHPASPLLRPHTSHKTPGLEMEVSTELQELKAAAHTYIWGRITSLVSSVSLNISPEGSEAAGANDCGGGCKGVSSEEERKAQAYVQLPFLIWLYAASGLAADVMRGAEEGQANTSAPPKTASSAPVLRSMTLADLLPTVDTLARQLQRHQYERVQPTAETLLTANTFLALTGVKMTDKAIMERLFPLQSTSAVNDALAFSTLQSTASLLGHEGNDFVDLSSTTTATFNQLATLASTTTASEAPLSIEEPLFNPKTGVASSEYFMARRESGTKLGGSPLRRIHGAVHNSTGSPPSGRETQLGHDHAAEVSTVEMYLGWLRGKENAAEANGRRASRDAAECEGGQGAVPVASAGLAATHTCVFRAAASGKGDEGEQSCAGSSDRSSSSITQSNSVDSCVTQQQQRDGVFRLSSMMPCADLSPCVARVERELHQARGALQFARKLGTLYATQDMNTLLPLLPTLVREEEKQQQPSIGNPHSARLESGSGVFRGSFDSWAVSGSPNAFIGSASLSIPSVSRPQPLLTSPPSVASAAMLPGGLPPLIVSPLPPSERHSSNPVLLTSQRATTIASAATLFPSILPPSMDRKSLIAHLNTCVAAMSSQGDQFFISSARALEVAFSLSLVLLSHVMGEAVLKGERAAVAPAKGGESSPSLVVKNPPFSISGTGAAGVSAALKGAESPMATGTKVIAAAAEVPKPRPLSVNLTQVFGFGDGHVRYQHLAMYVRETLISVALSALQQKDVIITQELLQYIALDTAISHHFLQVQEQTQTPLSSSIAVKVTESSQRVDSAAAAAAVPLTGPTTTPIRKTRKGAKPPARSVGRRVASLQNNSASFVNVWFSSFAQLADTTKHLLKGDHNTPSSLKDAVWHLAGLAQYFLLTRARGYDMYAGRNHLSPSSQPACADDLSTLLSMLAHNRGSTLRSSAAASLTASPALQHFIVSQLVDPAEKVLGVLVSFMESVAEALTADMDSGAAMQRQQRDGVVFVEMMSEDDNNTAASPAADTSDYLGSACDSLSQMSSEVNGGGCGGGGGCSAANRSEPQESTACWMELAVHYFLEIVDVLLDVSLYLPEKPLVIYQLTVGASRVPAFAPDHLDIMRTVGVSGSHSPPPTAADYLSHGAATLEGSAGVSPLERFQAFLSRYTSLVLQSAVTRFSVEGISMPARMAAAASGPPSNTPTTAGISEEAVPRTFMNSLLASVAASLTPVGLEDIALSSARPGAGQHQQQQPPLTSRSNGVPQSARAEIPFASSRSPGTARSTMWWPKARFQRYPHLVRIIEHAQLLCLYLNSSNGEEAVVARAPILAFMERAGHAAVRESPPCLRVSAVTALLNTSTGPCAQLLSVPYACPPLTVEANSYAANSVPNTSRDRPLFHSPMEQPQGRYGAVSGRASQRLVLSDRVLREVCGGLWIRVEVLQLLRLAAAPLDTANFASFTKMAAEVGSRVRDKTTQTHYKAVAAIKPSAESVLPKAYASTYVRLLFLRYVQAFYADMQALGAAAHATGVSPLTVPGASSASATQEHANANRTEVTGPASANHHHSGSLRPSWVIHTDPNNGESTTRSAVSPRAVAPLRSPLQDLSRRLWTQYCYQLLWALREVCWNSSEAHETANNLSIASVYGRLLQMIGGRPNHEEYEEEFEGDSVEDNAIGEPEFDLGGANLATIITFDRSLAPYCSTDGGKPEGFVDFESASSDSEGMKGAAAQPHRRPVFSSTQGPPKAATSSPRRSVPPCVDTTAQVSVNVSELTTLQSLELKHHLNRSSLYTCSSLDDSHTQHGATSATMAEAAAAAPVLPQLSLTGLKPPLYFASSGDTAAAQEDDYFKEQSKQRQKADQLEERQRNVASVSVMEASSYISDGDAEEEEETRFAEELEDCELSSGSPMSSPPNGSRTAEQERLQQAVQRSGPPASAALTIPKLSLGALGPPLYFTSAGDTGVFAEVTAPASPALPSPGGAAAPGMNVIPARGADAARIGGGASQSVRPADVSERRPMKNAPADPVGEGARADAPPAPALPSVATKTVGGFTLPRLSFGALGPPMYFTSTGDTGGFIEAQNAAPAPAPAPPMTKTVGGLALPKLSFGSLGPPMYFTSTGDTGGFVEAHNTQTTPASGKVTTTFNRSESQLSTNTARFRTGAAAHGAPPAVLSPESGNTPAAAASRYRDFSSSDDAASASVASSFGARAATHKDEDDGGSSDDTDSRGAPGSHFDGDSSLLSSAGADSEALPALHKRKKPRRRSPRLSVTPVVAPVVTMELILSLCSIILQRDSGMIQYGYTVSSLTQKRVLPGVSAAQRRWLNSGNNVAGSNGSGVFSPKSASYGAGMEASQADRWRYTPQHSPSSFHVIQALHNYLKDPCNTFVVDLLEEWMLDEYAEMERARMEHFEAEYGPNKHESRPRTLSLSSTLRSNLNSTTADAESPYTSAMSLGRFVLLRLLLPRAITHLVIPVNERRIGAGGYGSVTSGTVHALSGAAAALPANWGRRGCRWRPSLDARTGAGTARSASGSHGLGFKSPLTTERAMCEALDGLRTPWRVAAFHTAQAVCRCDVAIKHLSLSAQGSESGNLPVCHAEVLAMYRVRGHPYIVPLLSFDNTKEEYILVMPNYALGSFRVWRQKYYQLGYAVLSLPSEAHEPRKSGSAQLQRPLASPTLSSSLFATCARSLLQVLEAVVFMHEHHIRHGDIKCDNVLIDKANSNRDAKANPPHLPLSVRLCDFGSCDTCDDDDIHNLKNDIMAGKARFMAGRWGVGRGTEAIQPPEVMSATRRYTLFHRVMTTTTTTTSTASTSSPSPAPLERTDRGPHISSVLAPSVDRLGRTRAADSVEGEERALMERLRRAELSVDIWACGCLLYEMLTGRMLFGEARLGRLLVLAAADDSSVQDQSSSWRPSGAAEAKPMFKIGATVSEETVQGLPAASPSSSARQALDEWERRDLEDAVGKHVVEFMSCLLHLDPLQRPSAAEALYHWKEIMINMGFEV